MFNVSNSTCLPILKTSKFSADWLKLHWILLIIVLVYCVIFIGAVAGNLAIILLILKQKRFLFVANIFLTNLCLAEILVCLIALPITPVTLIRIEWDFGYPLCKFIPSFQVCTVLVASFSLCFIAFDRYRNIVHPTKMPLTTKQAMNCILIIWMLAICSTIPLFSSLDLKPISPKICGNFCGEFQWQSRTHQKVYGIFVLLLQFLCPLLLMSFLYWEILKKVHKDMIVLNHDRRHAREAAASRKKRVIRTLVLMVVIFIVSWLPVTLFNICRDLKIKFPYFLEKQSQFFRLLAHTLAMSSAVWNPLLYFWLSSKHMGNLKRKLRKFGSSMIRHCGPGHLEIIGTVDPMESVQKHLTEAVRRIYEFVSLPFMVGSENDESESIARRFLTVPNEGEDQLCESPLPRSRKLTPEQICDPFCDLHLDVEEELCKLTLDCDQNGDCRAYGDPDGECGQLELGMKFFHKKRLTVPNFRLERFIERAERRSYAGQNNVVTGF